MAVFAFGFGMGAPPNFSFERGIGAGFAVPLAGKFFLGMTNLSLILVGAGLLGSALGAAGGAAVGGAVAAGAPPPAALFLFSASMAACLTGSIFCA